MGITRQSNGVGNDETKRQIYDEALEGWETEFGADASIRKWVSHFREEVAPKLRDPSLAPNQESTNGRPPEQQQVSKLDNDSTDRYRGENSRSASPKPKPEGGSWNLDGSKSSPVQSSQGKRPRENDSDDEDRIETPPTKRPRPISHFDEPEGKIHDSIEFSPTKKLASSPLGERKVIQVGSERSSSSLSDLYVWNDREQRGPGVKEAPKAEQALNETQVTEDQSSQEKVERVRQIFQSLDEKIVVELLDLLRTAPLAPQEPDGVTPYDAAAIRTFHVFKNRDMAADWQQFNEIFATKLEKLGILGQLSQDDDEDSEEDEDGEGQGEQHNDEQDGQDEHHDGQQDDHQEEQYEQQHEHPGESEAPEIGAANGDIHHEDEHEPTVVPESPLRSATSQVNNSNDTTFTFVDSATQIDDDDSPSEYPIDLTTEEEAQAYITSRLNPPWAFSEAEILIALHATCSNSTVFADRVLRWMRQNDPTKGKGKSKERSRGRRSSIGPGDKLLPVIPGVWTGDDDEAVLGLADHEEEERIARKHGPARCRQRRAFLKSFE
ncbi:hypothetical protein JOL62DRAFT_557381 [Phyllosticta paracitricarpa]|uniref:TRF2-interacting telomeric protein/Rap1 C-terminal domain-containing protein n=1 Tax=Phyllosticta paracitricarpa TaxID=2016321 RepID=A0ABR1N3D0_9PEZI